MGKQFGGSGGSSNAAAGSNSSAGAKKGTGDFRSEKKSFKPRDGEKKPFKPRDGDKKPFAPRDGAKKPFAPRDGAKKPFKPRDGEKKPFKPRDGDAKGGKPAWKSSSKSDGAKGSDGPKKPWSGKPAAGGAKPWSGKPSAGGAKPWSGKPSAGGAKPRPGKKVTKADADRLREERSKAHKHFDAIERAVRCWNELRERKTSPTRRAELVKEVVTLFRGKVMEVILRHDASRVVQGCLKFGDAQARSELFREMKGQILYLTKAKHGHHLVERMLRHGDAVTRAGVLAELKGHMARLMTHNLGSLVIEAGFAHGWSPAQQWDLYQELYGPEYIHFKLPAPPADAKGAQAVGASRNLGAVLAARPDKRKAILECLFYTLARQADKGLLSLSVSQRLLSEFLAYAPPEQVVALIPVVRDQILALLATKEGAAAAALIWGYGTAKDRKLLFRALRGHMLDVGVHDHGHMALVAGLHFTDDTKLAAGSVFDATELRPHVPYLACHKFGRKVLLALLAPKCARYFTAWDMKLLAPLALPAYVQAARKAAGGPDGDEKGAEGKKAPAAAPAAAAAAGADGAAAGGDAAAVAAPSAAAQLKLPSAPGMDVLLDPAATALQPTSRKPEATRRSELLGAVAVDLQSACLTHTCVLARSKTSVPVLLEAAISLGNAPAYDSPDAAIMAAIADLAVSEPSPAVLEEQIAAMGAAAAAASAAAAARSKKLERALGTASGTASAPAAGVIAAATAAAATGGEGPAAKRTKFTVEPDAAPAAAAEEEGEEEAGGDDEEEGQDEEMGEDGEEEEEEGGDDDEEGEDEDEDDEDLDSDDDDEEGAAAAAAALAADVPALGEERLPVFEDSASHLLFKWLLVREALKGADRLEGGKPGRETDTEASAEAPATPVFGPLLAQRVAGRLASLATSNRACFIVLELANSADPAVRQAVTAELGTPAGLAALSAVEASPGRDALLRAMQNASAAPKAKASSAPAPAASASAAASKPGKAEKAKPQAAKPAAPAPKAAAPAPAAAPAAAAPAGGNAGKKRKERA